MVCTNVQRCISIMARGFLGLVALPRARLTGDFVWRDTDQKRGRKHFVGASSQAAQHQPLGRLYAHVVGPQSGRGLCS